ncbi:hypothetical protein SEUCBS140593_004071 [Sporothrix eucalyptigena]|uniref:Uncharacterized protein n=1 Tax=Sporothrix eucalyptigena TaxID=1812306 RepID=A0ABP0BJY5_9PEZI
MQTPSYLWLPLLVVALIRTVLAQALGADPSIQAPAATIQINTTVTVNLFGTLPPFTVDLIEAGTSVVVQVIVTVSSFTKVTKVTVLSTETVTKVKTDHDVTTVSTFATRTVTEPWLHLRGQDLSNTTSH